MARPLILSNGEMAIGLNEFSLVHDFYYPFVGLENHSSQHATRHKIGIFVDGKISWLDGGDWTFSQKYLGNFGLIGETVATNKIIGLRLEFQDFVDQKTNVFSRNIHLINLRETKREVKLFTHQAFIIGEAADGHDTAQFLPAGAWNANLPEAILHYKGRRAFLVSGENLQKNSSFDSFSVGRFGRNENGENLAGVWRDAEDGILAKNPCERIQTDSILEFDFSLLSHDSARANYFLAAGKSFAEASKNLAQFRKDGVHKRLGETAKFWRKWSAPARKFAEEKISPEYRESFMISLLQVKAMMDRRGALIASLDTAMLKNTFEAYVDCWPRDAANTLEVFLRIGYIDEVKQFLIFARDIMAKEGFFWQMYRPDASVGPNSHAYQNYHGEILLPIQEDETAAIVSLFCATVEKSIAQYGEKLTNWRNLFDELLRPAADFLADYIDKETKLPRPSYELWEMALETTTYTTAKIIIALEQAAALAEKFGLIDATIKWRNVANEMEQASEIFWNEDRGYFYRGIFRGENGEIHRDETIDIASLQGASLAEKYGFSDQRKISRAFQTFLDRFNISEKNTAAPRFENDDYHRTNDSLEGNFWFITTLWLAQYQLDSTQKNLENIALETENFTEKNLPNFREKNMTDAKDWRRIFAKNALDWANETIRNFNILPEQINAETGEMIAPAPLAWSHGEFMKTCILFGNTANDPFSNKPRRQI